MPAIGFGLVWGGYTGMLWAWCLLRGYNVTLGELVNPVHRLNWKTAIQQQIPQGQIMPGNPGGAGGGGSQQIPGTNEVKPGAGNSCPPGYSYDASIRRCVPLVNPNIQV